MALKTPKFEPKWKPVEGMEDGYRLGSHGSCWKGKKCWWASRPGVEEFQRFRGIRQAQAWVEEPLRKLFQERAGELVAARERKAAEREAKVNAAREVKAQKTWGSVPVAARVLLPGQIWGMKESAYQDRQVRLVAVRKDTVVVLVRTGTETWEGCPRDVRSVVGLLRLYRLLSMEGERGSHPSGSGHSPCRGQQ